MAAFSTSIVIGLFGLVATANASSQSIIRRDTTEDEMMIDLGASGNMKSVKRHAAAAEIDTLSMCDEDFPLGKHNSSDCVLPGTHKRILDSRTCIEAAKSALATVHMDSFYVSDAEKDDYPKGCSMRPCNKGTGVCFYYNGIGDLPLNPSGTPVCQRPRFQFGTNDTNGLGADCPAGYKLVFDEDLCEELAPCLGKGKGEPFLMGVKNNSKHNEFPEGCFMAHDPQNLAVEDVWFNPALPNTPKPTQPHGVPICNVSKFTKCHDTGCQAEDSHLLFGKSAVVINSTTDASLNEKHLKGGQPIL